jgi:hypothetical protein
MEMNNDTIIEEVRKAREELAKECGFDLHKAGDMIRKHQKYYKKRGWHIVTKEDLIRV